MKIANIFQMREIERSAIEDYGINSLILMENAAVLATEHIYSVMNNRNIDNAVIVVGNGNNGGDGLVCARLLHARNVAVKVVYCGNSDKGTQENLYHLKIVQKMGIDLVTAESDKDTAHEWIYNASVIVDGLLGTGTNKELRGVYREVVSMMNESKAYVIALDIPSGLSGDSGDILGVAVRAAETLSFGLGKVGLYAGFGKVCCGNISLMNIGIPPEIIEKAELNNFILTEKEVGEMMPERPVRSNKGSFGKVYLFAGSESMPGAALMAAKALYKTGAGLVKICGTKSVAAASVHGIWDAVTKELSNQNGFLCGDSYKEISSEIEGADIIVIGPGMGCNKDTLAFFEGVLKNSRCKMIIDADGLNMLAEKSDLFAHIKGRAVITPHPKEMSRLAKTSVSNILANTAKVALDFASHYGVVTLLKDSASIVADPRGKVYVNTSGCQAMAKAGFGDVLAGAIGGLAAQGMGIFEAACLGCYLHGKAGEIAAENGQYGVMASELPAYLPLAMKK